MILLKFKKPLTVYDGEYVRLNLSKMVATLISKDKKVKFKTKIIVGE
jgi:hypothetical protein